MIPELAILEAESTGGSSSARRKNVLWVGGTPPDSLVGLLLGHQLTVVPITASVNSIRAHAAPACGLVLQLPPDVDPEAWARDMINVALDHGLLVIFTSPDFPQSKHVEEERERRRCIDSTTAMIQVNRVHAVTDATKIVRQLDDHKPGAGANEDLQIAGDIPSDASVVTLLRRAFADLHGVTLKLLQGGKSGASVWIAHPSARDLDRRLAPFLVKSNSVAKMQAEESNFSLFAQDAVSFRLRPPVHSARCVTGAQSALLVFDFIDRAISFRSAIRSYPAGQLIGSLFDHTLAGCLSGARDVTTSLVTPFVKINALRWSDDLRAAATIARQQDPDTSDVDTLKQTVEALPAVKHRVATSHSDLHTGNLLVAAGSSDVLLIDFGAIVNNMPVVTDAAGLEVSMTFAPQDVREELGRTCPTNDKTWLEKVYEYPMDPHTVGIRDDGERWLSEAVRAIRGAARQHDPDPRAYAVAIAAYLIRYASYADNEKVEDRALAYRIAVRVIASVMGAK